MEAVQPVGEPYGEHAERSVIATPPGVPSQPSGSVSRSGAVTRRADAENAGHRASRVEPAVEAVLCRHRVDGVAEPGSRHERERAWWIDRDPARATQREQQDRSRDGHGGPRDPRAREAVAMAPQVEHPANTGPEPIPTMVPSATPVRRSPANQQSWYIATARPPMQSARRWTPQRRGRSTVAGPGRAARARALPGEAHGPTPRPVLALGPSACAVPVVPNSAAAPTTASTGARRASERTWGGAMPGGGGHRAACYGERLPGGHEPRIRPSGLRRSDGAAATARERSAGAVIRPDRLDEAVDRKRLLEHVLDVDPRAATGRS